MAHHFLMHLGNRQVITMTSGKLASHSDPGREAQVKQTGYDLMNESKDIKGIQSYMDHGSQLYHGLSFNLAVPLTASAELELPPAPWRCSPRTSSGWAEHLLP